MHSQRPLFDTSHINEEDGMAGPAQYLVSIGVVPACMNPSGLVKTAPRTLCRCQACSNRTRVHFQQRGPEQAPAESGFAPNSNENQRSLNEGDVCMYRDHEKGEIMARILKIRKIRAGDGNNDFEYTINVGQGHPEKVTYASNLRPIATANDEPSAPPLMEGAYTESPLISEHRVVHMV